MKIAIIGGGIVGSTASFYLSKAGHTIHLYDDTIGQATRAAAGLICPWLSQRRNKDWYTLVNNGAHFYDKLLKDLNELNIDTSFYRNTGVVAIKKDNNQINKLHELAIKKQSTAPKLKSLSIVTPKYIEKLMPEITINSNGLLAHGGSVIDGKRCIRSLLTACSLFDFKYIHQTIETLENFNDTYDFILLTMGARSKKLLENLHYDVDIYPQKGQLFGVTLKNKNTSHYPVIMPQGETDILPFENGKWIIGATHENNMAFDLSVDNTLLEQMKLDAQKYLPELEHTPIGEVRVGTRAYTSDFTPFFGFVPQLNNTLIASGLGSSGLTSGPYIGYLLNLMVQNKNLPIDETVYSPNKYIKKL